MRRNQALPPRVYTGEQADMEKGSQPGQATPHWLSPQSPRPCAHEDTHGRSPARPGHLT